MSERRLLLVHAHPDDETIVTGGVMARYAAEGAAVTLVTCTRGEEGEIVPEDLRHLGTGKPLADVRVVELGKALAALGVVDHHFLGPYEDSGMIGTAENEKGTAFWNADLDEAAGHLVRIVRRTRPHVVVTYDERGGYGHPDHIQAHRVTMLALQAAADPTRAPRAGDTWTTPKLYFVAWGPPGRGEREAASYERAGRPGGFDLPTPRTDEPPSPEVTTAVDVSRYVDRKLAALDAHRTQLTRVDRFFALSNNVAHEVLDHEWFTLVRGPRGTADPATGLEADLFGGLDPA